MRIPISLSAAWLSVLGTPAAGATLAEGQAAYGLFDVNKAETLYREVAQTGSSEDRPVAARELARIAWLVDGDDSRAIKILEDSLPNDPDPCPAALLYGRILNAGSTPQDVLPPH